MGSILTTKQSAWQLRGTVAAGITTPGVTSRDKASVEALAGIFIDILPATNAAIFRASGATENTVRPLLLMVRSSLI